MLRTPLPRRRDCGRAMRFSGKKTKRRAAQCESYTRTWDRRGWLPVALFLVVMLSLPGVLSDRDSIVALTAVQRAPAQPWLPPRARSRHTDSKKHCEGTGGNRKRKGIDLPHHHRSAARVWRSAHRRGLPRLRPGGMRGREVFSPRIGKRE